MERETSTFYRLTVAQLIVEMVCLHGLDHGASHGGVGVGNDKGLPDAVRVLDKDDVAAGEKLCVGGYIVKGWV